MKMVQCKLMDVDVYSVYATAEARNSALELLKGV